MAYVVLGAYLLLAGQGSVEADYVIRGATVYDGTGKPAVRADVAIRGQRIVAVGTIPPSPRAKTINANGLVLTPGFIDLHTHSDYSITRPATRANLNYLTQGVTTIVTGNCGFGPVGVAEYYRKIDRHGAGTNVLHLIPHGTLRRQVMGNVNRPPTDSEMNRMRSLVDREMRAGAWGFCTGLIYTPGMYASTDELVALAEVAAEHGGIYASHIRGEGTELLVSVTEAITIGRRAGLPVHISHFKASGRKAWGLSADAIGLIEQARQKGQVVTADQYPYTASSTSLTATVVPGIFREGKNSDLIARLDDKKQGQELRNAIEERLREHDGGKSIRIASYRRNRRWQGKDLARIAQEEGRSVLAIAIEILRNGGAQIVNFGMNEEDVRLIMRQPWVATASDGSARVPSGTVPHPRNYGCFPRKIRRYAFEDRVVSVAQAVRSATGLPADILRLPKRGYIKPDYYADILIFDPKTFRDLATFDQPEQYSTGVEYLFVNGVLTIDRGKYTGELAGRAIRHTSPRTSKQGE